MQDVGETNCPGKDAPTSDKRRRPRPLLLFVNKTASSSSLSHSEGAERIQLLSVAQRVSRVSAKQKSPKASAAGVMQENSAQPRESNGRLRCLGGRNSRTRQQSSTPASNQLLLSSPPVAMVYRVQLTAHFLESYYPPGMPGRADVVDKLRQWIQPSKAAVALAAADSMILLHAARTGRNKALQEEGMLIYQMALRLLRSKLQHADSALDDAVLCAVEVMSVVETMLLNRSKEDNEEVSRAHLGGLYGLFVARGPSILQSTVGRNILLQRLHEPLMVSLLARKASVFGNAEWQAAFQSIDGDGTGKMHRLTSLGCRIPGMFEKADAAINNGQQTFQQYMELLTELITLEERFMKWLHDRARETSAAKAQGNTAPFPSTLLCNQPARPRAWSCFPTSVHYNSFLDALAHINYWGLLLMLRKTILDVLVSLESAHLPSSHPELTSPDMRAKCNETADLFCQNAFYVCRLSGPRSRIAKQGMIAFLVSIVLPWYSQNQDVEKVTWCRNLIENFQKEHEDLDLVESVQNSWTTKLYIGWINMAF